MYILNNNVIVYMLIYSTVSVKRQMTKKWHRQSTQIDDKWFISSLCLQTHNLGRIEYYSIIMLIIHVINILPLLLKNVETCRFCFSISENIQLSSQKQMFHSLEWYIIQNMNKTLKHVIYIFIVKFMQEKYHSGEVTFSLFDFRRKRYE